MHDELAVFKTPLGWCAMLGRGEVLRSLTFGHRNADSAIGWLKAQRKFNVRQSSWNPSLAERIAAVLAGERDDLRDVPIELDHLTPFGRKVIVACRRISWGQTRSYAQLAALAGRPAAARAVGSVMSKNRTPLVVPCHRVIGSGGNLGGYSAPQGLTLKRRLLAMESGVKRKRESRTPILT